MDANLRNLLEKRDQVLDRIQENLDQWDGAVETGLAIVEKNGENFGLVQALDLELKKISHPAIYSDDYLARLTHILEGHENLLASLKKEQASLLDKIREIKKKDQVIDSYISRETDSFFIDKDL